MKYINLNEVLKDTEYDELFENFEVIEGVFEYRLKLMSYDKGYKDPLWRTVYDRKRSMVEYGFNGEWKSLLDIVAVATEEKTTVHFAPHSDKIYVNNVEVLILKDNSEYV